MQIPHRRPTRFCSDPRLCYLAQSRRIARTATHCLHVGGAGGTSEITLKYLAPQITVNSGAISGFYCTPHLNTIYSKYDDTHITSFCLVQKGILFHIQLEIFVWDSGRWKLKILIRQGKSVKWIPSHSLSKHKIMFTMYLYPCSVPQLYILHF